MPHTVPAGALAVLKDVMAVAGSICMLLLTIFGAWLTWRRFTREKTKEEVTAAEGLVRLTSRVDTLETWRQSVATEHETLRTASDQGIEAVQTEIAAMQQQAQLIENQCERHKITLHAQSLENAQSSIRRINGRCDELRDQIVTARERADDRYVLATQHDKDLVAQAHTLDALQQHVNSLAALVTKALNGRA